MADFSKEAFVFNAIGVFHGNAARKYDVPRQGALGGGTGYIALNAGMGFEVAVRDLMGFDRIWVVFAFNRNRGPWRPTVRPPVPAKGKNRVGVFASRSPYRPNPIGISCVRLVGVKKLKVCVSETDLLDGTPVFDIKPYIPRADSFPEAKAGWVDEQHPDIRTVTFSELFLRQAEKIALLGGPDIENTVRIQLSMNPLDATRKRVAPLDSEKNKWTLSLRMFRIDFCALPNDSGVFVERIRSGYSPEELINDSEDKYGDKKLHRLFTGV